MSPLPRAHPYSLSEGVPVLELFPFLRDIFLLHLDEPVVASLEQWDRWTARHVYPLVLDDFRYAPYLQPFDALETRTDEIYMPLPIRDLLQTLIQEHQFNAGFLQSGNILSHYLRGLFLPDAGVYCILTLTHQTAITLWKYGGARWQNTVHHLAGVKSPPAFGATFFTEITGGSDLSRSQTTGQHAPTDEHPDRYLLTGEKYFASNGGIADYAFVSGFDASSTRRSIRDLRLWVVPRLRPATGELNYRLRRLKPKSGSLLVPTGEVILHESEGFLLPDPERHIYYLVETLMHSRLDNCAGALALAFRAFAEAWLFARDRQIAQQTLIRLPFMQEEFRKWEGELRALLNLTLYTLRLFQECWQDRPPEYSVTYHVVRVLTHLLKFLTARRGIALTQWGIEVWGGRGTLLEYPPFRFLRDMITINIWEGTPHVQVQELAEALRKTSAGSAFLERISRDFSHSFTARSARESLHQLETILAGWKEGTGSIVSTYAFERTALRFVHAFYTLCTGEELPPDPGIILDGGEDPT